MPPATPKLFGRERPLHQVFGGGKFADIVLWRKKEVSASLLIVATVAWLLFRVAGYHFFALLCYITMLGMIVYFLWSNAAAFVDLPAPKVPEAILSERTTRQVILALHRRLNWFIATLHDIACGKDLKLFLLTITSLWVASIVGSWFSSITLLYLVVLCLLTLPALYEQYESEVDYLAAKGKEDLKRLFSNIDSEVLNKIPRGTVKEKKYK